MTTAISNSAEVFRALVVVVLCAAIAGCDARRRRGRGKVGMEPFVDQLFLYWSNRIRIKIIEISYFS